MKAVLNNRLQEMLVRLSGLGWSEFSRLFLVGDGAGWALDEDMRELSVIAKKLGILVQNGEYCKSARKQSVFFSSIDLLTSCFGEKSNNRFAASYFHGRPGQGNGIFDERFRWLCRYHHDIHRLHVSNSSFKKVILESNIDEGKVHIIPIGVNLNFFNKKTPLTRKTSREYFGLPQSAVIVGSFQKDGDGWGNGDVPKLIKGPDVFVNALIRIKRVIPEVYVLLSGPARGYVKNELIKNGIKYKHLNVNSYSDMGKLYQCLDLYLVTSREEGGPKSILESMASGIPLVTTKVGQATDLVVHGENAWMSEIEDDESLAHWGCIALEDRVATESVVNHARQCSERYSYDNLVGEWRVFMDGFVNFQ